MRRDGAVPAEREKPKGESADERDARLEQSFTYDRRGERTTMAFVSAYRDELVEEFFAWREREYQSHRTTGEGIFDGLRRWEVSRFGSRLDNGPHGILLFGVRINLAPVDGGRVIPPGYFDRPAVVVTSTPGDPVKRLARGMTPPRKPSRAQTDERLMELRRQADGLVLDTDGVA